MLMRHRRWKCSSSTSLCRLWSLGRQRLWLTSWLPLLVMGSSQAHRLCISSGSPPGVSTAGPWRWPAFSSSECHHGHGRHRGVEKLKLVPINTYGFLLTFIGSSLPVYSHYHILFPFADAKSWHYKTSYPAPTVETVKFPMINLLWYLSRSCTPLIKSDRYIISREYLIENKVKKPRRTFPLLLINDSLHYPG